MGINDVELVKRVDCCVDLSDFQPSEITGITDQNPYGNLEEKEQKDSKSKCKFFLGWRVFSEWPFVLQMLQLRSASMYFLENSSELQC